MGVGPAGSDAAPYEGRRLSAGGGCWTFFMSIIQSDYMYGQIDCFVFLLLMLSAKNFERNPSRSGLWGGGAAIAAKLMPIVLLPVLAIRNWKTAACAIAAIIVLAIVIPFLFAGPALIDYYTYWYQHTIASEMAVGDAAEHSATLAAIVSWLVGFERPPFLLKAVSGLFLLVFPILLLRRKKILEAFFLALMLIPLTASRTESHHFVVIIPSFMLLGCMLLGRSFEWDGHSALLSTKQTIIGWCAMLADMLLILWGNHAGFPLHAIGMFLLFLVTFWSANHLTIAEREPRTGGVPMSESVMH